MALEGGTPASIEKAYVNNFRAGFAQAYQQTESHLQPYFESGSQSSEFDYQDRIGIAEDMQEDNTRYGDNPTSDIEHDRRRTHLRSYELGKYVDPKDLMQVLTDPMNAYSQAFYASGNRKKDDVIIDRYFGPSYRGKAGEIEVQFVDKPSSGKIRVGQLNLGQRNKITAAGRYELGTSSETEGIRVAKDFVFSGSPADTGITIDKMQALRTTMIRVHAARLETIINLFLGSSQFEQLSRLEEIRNGDYNTRKSLAEGLPTVWNGYRFIHTEGLPVDSDGARRCIAALPRAFRFVTGKSLEVDIWQDTGKKKIPYMYMKQSIDGTRMWGELSGEIACID